MENQETNEAQLSEQKSDNPNYAAKEPTPDVCSYKVLYGKSKKPLFFVNNDNQYFDCHREEWLPEEPMVASELDSRPMNAQDDLLYAIVHGLINENDYNLLSAKGVISDPAKRIWEKMKHLSGKIEESQKSLLKSEDSADDLSLESEQGNESQESDFDEIDGLMDDLFADFEEEGEDVVAQLHAMASQLCVEPKLEAVIRKIVQEELSKQVSPQVDSTNAASPIDATKAAMNEV